MIPYLLMLITVEWPESKFQSPCVRVSELLSVLSTTINNSHTGQETQRTGTGRTLQWLNPVPLGLKIDRWNTLVHYDGLKWGYVEFILRGNTRDKESNTENTYRWGSVWRETKLYNWGTPRIHWVARVEHTILMVTQEETRGWILLEYIVCLL